MLQFHVILLSALALCVRPERVNCNLPCPIDTFSQDYSSQIYGSPLPVYPPLTVTVNYDKAAKELELSKESAKATIGTNEKSAKERVQLGLIHNILHLPGVIADTLTQTDANK